VIEGIAVRCSPALETKGSRRILEKLALAVAADSSSGRPNRRRPGHQGAQVSGAQGRGEVGTTRKCSLGWGCREAVRFRPAAKGMKVGSGSTQRRRSGGRLAMGRGAAASPCRRAAHGSHGFALSGLLRNESMTTSGGGGVSEGDADEAAQLGHASSARAK
jgi:hypothetical protein